jgi:hypothetical protein
MLAIWGLSLLLATPKARGYLANPRTNNRATRDLARQISLAVRGTGRRTREGYRARAHHLNGPRVVSATYSDGTWAA